VFAVLRKNKKNKQEYFSYLTIFWQYFSVTRRAKFKTRLFTVDMEVFYKISRQKNGIFKERKGMSFRSRLGMKEPDFMKG